MKENACAEQRRHRRSLKAENYYEEAMKRIVKKH